LADDQQSGTGVPQSIKVVEMFEGEAGRGFGADAGAGFFASCRALYVICEFEFFMAHTIFASKTTIHYVF
jgi:hypothetical protein